MQRVEHAPPTAFFIVVALPISRSAPGEGDEIAVRCPRAELARRAEMQAAVDLSVDGNAVRAAIAQLSDRDRAMIYRSYYLGRTTTQIAAELGTDDDLVKHELHRALHALRIGLQGGREITRRR